MTKYKNIKLEAEYWCQIVYYLTPLKSSYPERGSGNKSFMFFATASAVIFVFSQFRYERTELTYIL